MLKSLKIFLQDFFFVLFLNKRKRVWWISKGTIGDFVKNQGLYIFSAGYTYRIDKWEKMLNKANDFTMKYGRYYSEFVNLNLVYNPYRGKYTTINKVEFDWTDDGKIKWVYEMVIWDENGDLIYHID